MNKQKQFFALVNYQIKTNPFICFFPLVIAVPNILIHSIIPNYHPFLSNILIPQNSFFIFIITVWALAPEMLQGRGNKKSDSGTEFLFTRAIDRSFVFRVRTSLAYFLIMLFPVAILLYATIVPAAVVQEFSLPVQEALISNIPGAIKTDTDLISMPQGNLILGSWYCWLFSTFTVCNQVYLLLLHPLRQRLVIYYVSMAPILLLLSLGNLSFSSNFKNALPTWSENLFFMFGAHPIIFWSVTVTAMILGQIWSERRFATLEQ